MDEGAGFFLFRLIKHAYTAEIIYNNIDILNCVNYAQKRK